MKATSLWVGRVPSIDEDDEPDTFASAPAVALIGAGPSGMFFLHALATRIRDLEATIADAEAQAKAQGNANGNGDAMAQARSQLANLPVVTCYEMSDGPGGLWRSDRKDVARRHNPKMYDTLWTNVPKELTEFADYTYEQHFGGKQTPAFLPRRDTLDYILKRTTSVDADLLQSKGKKSGKAHRRHEIRYQTTVHKVTYNKSTAKFEVTASATAWEGDDEKHERCASQPDVMEQFDYCIWAAGRHGKPRIPRPLLALLQSGVAPYDENDHDSITTPTDKEENQKEQTTPFRGTILHSSHMENFEQHVRNKRVVLVGDSSSAEDLALKAIRDGVDMVYILSRSGYGDVTEVGSWPGNRNPKTGKVKPKVKTFVALPYQVVNDGTGLRCCEIEWNQEDEVYELDEEAQPFTLEKIDTIIFCTGYAPNLDCLDPDLKFAEHEDCFWTAPSSYEMTPNPLSANIGRNIRPSDELDISSRMIPGVCRHALMSNPNMFFLADVDAETPLFELDVSAWLVLSQISGYTARISRKEMEQEIRQHMLEEMDIPYLRWEMDMNYFEAICELPDEHWSGDWKDERSKEIDTKQAEFYAKVLARNMRLAKYPVDFGTFDELNEDGTKRSQLYLPNHHARIALDRKSPDAEWKTYRDYDPKQFRSIVTGQEACPLPAHWLDLERNGKPIAFGADSAPTGKRSSSGAEKSVEALVGALSLQISAETEERAPTVALIGCGPSGMFFLHALATRRKRLMDANDTDVLAMLPRVTCFESSDKPGGIWRSQEDTVDEAHQPNIYDDCWSNKPKELVEFFDYTFEEHFQGKEAPVYLPKTAMREYMLKRVHLADPNVFDAVKFSASVQSILYNSSTEKFEVQYQQGAAVQLTDGVAIKEQFDYCICATGQHARPRIPRQLLKLLRTGRSQVDIGDDDDEGVSEVPFQGTVLHSSHKSDFSAAVCEKTVVLVGDSASAEDSALHAVKLGARSVHILSRSGYGVCNDTGSWPGVDASTGEAKPKIHVHIALPYKVTNAGTGLRCCGMEWSQEDEVWERDEEAPIIEIDNVDTIIFCTGYMSNQDFLSPDLQIKDRDSVWDEAFWVAPPDFRMRPNELQSSIGHIQPSKELDYSSNIIPGLYRNVLIKNPRMVHLASLENTLLELDVAAWQCLAYITGDAVIPPKKEMEDDIQKQMLEEMHLPYLRWEMDMNYFEALNTLRDDHWSEDCKDSRTRAINEEHARYLAKALARNMRCANYPVDFGSYSELNEMGEKFVQIELQDDYARSMLDPKGLESEWMTFRDVDPKRFKSIFTDQPASALPGHWIDIGKGNTTTK